MLRFSLGVNLLKLVCYLVSVVILFDLISSMGVRGEVGELMFVVLWDWFGVWVGVRLG